MTYVGEIERQVYWSCNFDGIIDLGERVVTMIEDGIMTKEEKSRRKFVAKKKTS